MKLLKLLALVIANIANAAHFQIELPNKTITTTLPGKNQALRMIYDFVQDGKMPDTKFSLSFLSSNASGAIAMRVLSHISYSLNALAQARERAKDLSIPANQSTIKFKYKNASLLYPTLENMKEHLGGLKVKIVLSQEEAKALFKKSKAADLTRFQNTLLDLAKEGCITFCSEDGSTLNPANIKD